LIALRLEPRYIMALTQKCRAKNAHVLSVDNPQQTSSCLLINILLLVLGTPRRLGPSILIATPILLPVMQNFGRIGSLRHDHALNPRIGFVSPARVWGDLFR